MWYMMLSPDCYHVTMVDDGDIDICTFEWRWKIEYDFWCDTWSWLGLEWYSSKELSRGCQLLCTLLLLRYCNHSSIVMILMRVMTIIMVMMMMMMMMMMMISQSQQNTCNDDYHHLSPWWSSSSSFILTSQQLLLPSLYHLTLLLLLLLLLYSLPTVSQRSSLQWYMFGCSVYESCSTHRDDETQMLSVCYYIVLSCITSKITLYLSSTLNSAYIIIIITFDMMPENGCGLINIELLNSYIWWWWW